MPALLTKGQRRDCAAHAADQLFGEDLSGRIVSFDSAAGTHFALVRAQRTRAGRPISTEDTQIAAIALAANRVLVTRATKDFEGLEGLTVLNPWHER